MVSKKCLKFIESLKKAFENTPYPKKDFFDAIAEMEYYNIQNTNEKNQIKKWDEIDEKTLLKYYDFLLFLDFEGQVYYLPIYLISLLSNDKLHDTWIYDTLMTTLFNLDMKKLDNVKIKATLDALQCLYENCLECDKEMLEDVLRKISSNIAEI